MPNRWDMGRWTRKEDGSYTRELEPKPEFEATAAAETLADELGVDLSEIEGTGKDGKITVGDVKASASE